MGRGVPSSELRMHLLVYRVRPDVAAAVHAHPVHAVALSLVGVSLAGCLLPETVLSLGSVPTAGYATPTTEEVPESLRHLLEKSNAIVLARHGTLTLGADLTQAYNRLESLEHTAHITAVARAIGPVSVLSQQERQRLEDAARALGIETENLVCSGCETCGSPDPDAHASTEADPDASRSAAARSPDDLPVETIVARVLQRLLKG